MGVVYRAEDVTLGRTVALKFLPPTIVHDRKRVERFREEARTASALNHPNICTIYEVGEEQGEVFIAMEYVEGRPLSEFIRENGLPASSVLRYGRQIAAALEHAHGRGIVHRDLKPLNVMITAEGDAKILDFGLARRSDPSEVSRRTLQVAPTETTVGMAGTMPYMSPEQLEGAEATPRSDIWSLGVLLYEMTTGVRPFGGENLYRLCTAIIQEAYPPVPESVPPGLAAVIRRCLEKEPARRYQRASEVRAALEALEPSTATGIVPPVAPPHGHFAWWMAGAMAAAALVMAGLWWYEKNPARSAAAVGAEPARVQLAVLPPEAESQPETTAFDSGLTETLTSNLTGLTEKHPLAVIPASEIRSKGVKTLDAAREEFGVNLGLMLNVQRAGSQVRVNYSLVDAKSHQQLRGGTVTAEAANPFALQDEVTSRVVETLKLQLQPGEKEALSAHGTTEPAAYDYYLQGRGFLLNYDKAENVDNAIAVFRRALEKDPNFAAAYAGLGEANWRKYQSTHDKKLVKEATDACQEAAKRDSELSVAHTCLGRVFQGTGQPEKAVAEYQKAADHEPTLDEAQAGLARAYESLNRLDEAEKSYRAAIALRPNYWDGYNRLGAFELRHGKMEEASQMFAQVVELVPDSFMGYGNLGALRLEQGKYDEAIPYLKKSLEIRKTSSALSNLATAYFQLKRYDQAAEAYEEAVRLEPQNYVLWGNLGDAYFWTPGKHPEAAAAYRKAIALGEEALRVNPKDAGALSSISLYHAMNGEREKSSSALKKALALEPKRVDLLLNAAIGWEQLGDREQALGYLEKAVAEGLPAAQIKDYPNFDGEKTNARFQRLSGKKQ